MVPDWPSVGAGPGFAVGEVPASPDGEEDSEVGGGVGAGSSA